MKMLEFGQNSLKPKNMIIYGLETGDIVEMTKLTKRWQIIITSDFSQTEGEVEMDLN